MTQNRIGVLGATSMVGGCLLPALTATGTHVTAFSRSLPRPRNHGVDWVQLSDIAPAIAPATLIHHWISLAPIWALPECFALLEAHGARRIVVLSSTSLFTKQGSNDPQEQAVAQKLADAERRISDWAQSGGVEWVVLRPTLIYGLRLDKNITEIAGFIRRFGFFPVFGKAVGLRQPIHTADVASACLSALNASAPMNRAYNISGGETLTYRDMVARVFAALGRPVRLLPVPLWAFGLAVSVLRRLPKYRQWSSAMAERMGQDLVFSHSEAQRDFAFNPRPFVLAPSDLPQ